MPWEDRAAYQSHCAEILQSLAPVGKLETQCAQAVADEHWRLNRARAVDTNMFALGQFEYAPATGDSQIDAALNSARAFRDHSKAFVNLSLYEQRINRSLEKNFDRLAALQKERKEQEFLAGRREARKPQTAAHSPAFAAAGQAAQPAPAAKKTEPTFVYASAAHSASITPEAAPPTHSVACDNPAPQPEIH